MFTPEISPARAHARPGFDDFCQDLSRLVLRQGRLFAGGSRNLPITSWKQAHFLTYVKFPLLRAHALRDYGGSNTMMLK